MSGNACRLRRVAVVGARERRINGPILVGVHDLHNDSIGSTDGHEGRDHDQNDVQSVQGFLPEVASPVIGMVLVAGQYSFRAKTY